MRARVAPGAPGLGRRGLGGVHAALGGTWHEAVVSDPLGRPHPASWLVLPDGRAVVEAAAAIGCDGSIVGRALYENRFTLEEALSA